MQSPQKSFHKQLDRAYNQRVDHSPHNIVSSLEALTDSIDHDGQVYRWFAFLVAQAPVRSRLVGEGKGKEWYQRLNTVSAGYASVMILGLLMILGTLYIGEYIYLWGALILVYPLIKLSRSKKRCVKEITRQLLEKDFERSELCQKTFYQLSELYRRKYDIPSFIDAVYFADAITRKSLLIAIFCIPFVIQMNLWQAALTIIGAYWIPYLIANHPLAYRRLK